MEVRLENLVKTFPGTKNRPDTTAVNDMTFTITDGKLVGLLGPSGCGKSTTLYMIAGLHKPTAGKIWFGDTDVTNVPPENRGIGLVFQNYALYPHLTVRENIMFPLRNIRPRMPKETMHQIAQEMAALVDIGRYLDRKPKELSGGQQQRVAIARALAKKPQVLLLDEPLSNLDARLRLQTREEIKRIQRETKITTVFVTHDQEEAMSISDEIVVMKDGVVQQIGEPQYVYDEPANMFVAKFLGSPAINIFDAELKENKLLINGVVLETGLGGKGELDFKSSEVYEAVVKLGFIGTKDEYDLALEGGSIQDSNLEEGQVKPTKKPGRNKKVVLTSEEAYARLKDAGLSVGMKGFIDEIENIKAEKGLNRQVKIGIRPENFLLNADGEIPVAVSYIEHIGRDISIIGLVENQENKLRIIIPSDLRKEVADKKLLHFGARRFYLFERNGLRIK